MASSRLEKIGTIFTRTSGLLRSGAMKVQDKPVWYDVVATFPPKYEPKYDRPAPNIEVKQIFYAEDKIRAKYYASKTGFQSVNLSERQHQTNVQKFIGIYKKLEAQGALDEEKIFETALEMLNNAIATDRTRIQTENENMMSSPAESRLVSDFSDAQKVKISDIFKD